MQLLLWVYSALLLLLLGGCDRTFRCFHVEIVRRDYSSGYQSLRPVQCHELPGNLARLLLLSPLVLAYQGI